MKTKLTRYALIFCALFIVADEVFGVLGGRRRTRRRTAVVVGSSVHAADSAQISQSEQEAAAADQRADDAEAEAAAANKEAEAAKQQAAATPAPAPAATPAPAPAATGGKLPVGTVVAQLPPGATATPVDGVQYYYSNGNFYRAVFQGNSLVYVTAEPK